MSEMSLLECGLNDAWRAARKIFGVNGFSCEELVEIFGTANRAKIFADNSATEAIKKIGDYEASKRKIGNVVRKKTGIKEVGVITKITTDYKYCIVMLSDGDSVPWSLDDVALIGHMDEINDIIKSLSSFYDAKGDTQ